MRVTNISKSQHLVLSLLAFVLTVVTFDTEAGRGRGGPPVPIPPTSWTVLYGTSVSEYGRDIAIDAAGSAFTVGYTFGDLGATNQGFVDATLAKHDINGNLLWVRQIGTLGSDTYFGVTTDTSGNVYAVGGSEGDLAGNNLGDTDIIVYKYDTNGVLLFSFQTGTSTLDRAESIAVDSVGNIYVCGMTWGNLGGALANPNGDAFLAKYSAAGQFLWADQIGRVGTNIADECHDVAVDSADNVYIVGDYSTFDYFVGKYDTTGNRDWLIEGGTTSSETANSIAVDLLGNVFIGGATGGTLNGVFAGWVDAYVVKFDNTGAHLWARQLGTANRDETYGVAVDSAGSVYIAGLIDRGIAPPFGNVFTAKYNSAGTQQYLREVGASSDAARGIAVNAAGTDYYLVGETAGNLDGETNNGAVDIFVTRNRP